MKNESTLHTGDQITSALHALGVNFILGDKNTKTDLHKEPSRLITSLAESNEARLRLSLIPLFLEHPEYAAIVHKVAKEIRSKARLTLQCYYTAAVYLAKKYTLTGIFLPDHFSKELNLRSTDNSPDENLRSLATRQKELSGSYVNWLATYQHAEKIWRRGKQK